MDVFLSDKAASKLADISDYLLESFGLRVRDEFFEPCQKKCFNHHIILRAAQSPTSSKTCINALLLNKPLSIIELNGMKTKLRSSPSSIIGKIRTIVYKLNTDLINKYSSGIY